MARAPAKTRVRIRAAPNVNRDLVLEVTEAREQQAVVSEILRLISRSPRTVQAVFDAIVKSGARLFAGMDVSLRLVKEDRTETVASTILLDGALPVPLDDSVPSSRAILRRKVIHTSDYTKLKWVNPISASYARKRGYRALLIAPLLTEDRALGAIMVTRRSPGRFSEKQIALLKTFADQAVIAIENARLFDELEARNRDLGESLEQQTATADILRVIASSPTEIQPVLDAVAESAARLCGASDALIRRVEGNMMRVVAHVGPVHVAQTRMLAPITRGSANGTAILECRTIHVQDIAETHARAEYPEGSFALAEAGFRTILVAPLIREGAAIGTVVIRRREAQPFTHKQIKLLETFADQAVIAIENVRLFSELQTRNRELTQSLEHQTATSDILGVISQYPTDVTPVFETIMKNAVNLCDSQIAAIFRFDGELVHIAGTYNWPPEALASFSAGFPSPPNPALISGRVILSKSLVRESDALSDPKYDHALAVKGTWRRVIGVPLLRDGEPIGVINLAWTEPGETPEYQVELLKTFASQAVIAIENVRLFKELEARNVEVTESLEQQTATAEILRVISSSPTDIQPVFEAILENATRLCGAQMALLGRYDGETYETVAHRGVTAELGKFVRNRGAYRPPVQGAIGRMIALGKTIHIPDLRDTPGYRDRTNPNTVGLVDSGGVRTYLAVPLLKEGQVAGGITIYRCEVHPFTQKQIDLVSTFADQAVIAIENVRLFKELQARNAEITEALEQQTATAEVLKVISRSTFDLGTVLQTLMDNAARLCRAKRGVMFRRDGESYRIASIYNGTPELQEYLQSHSVAPNRKTVTGRSIAERRPVHVHDVLVDVEYEWGDAARLGNYRTVLSVPLLREGEPMGSIALMRDAVEPFSAQEIALVTTFADQAGIAIENVRLLTELQGRNSELTESLEQQTATAEILRVISSARADLEPVFKTILEKASQLCEANLAGLWLYDGEVLTPTALQNVSPESAEVLRARRVAPGTETTVRLAALERKVVHSHDILHDPRFSADAHPLYRLEGARPIVCVPLVREDALVGVIGLWRKEVRPFSDRQIELVRVFADQAVIAIENVRLFNEIQEKSRQLETANRHKSEFLAGMSHELRTPLNAILGFSEVLQEQMFGEINEKQAEYFNDIHSSGAHLLSLINDILDLSKIEAGRMDLELSSFNLPTALENALTLIRERATRHGIRLELDCDGSVGEWTADERKFKQIMLNLLSNAVKFTPAGGRIAVKAQRTNGAIEIAVSDTGVGIKPEDQALVFQEFRQVGGDTLKKAEGTGLGLALTKKFVELHDGTISLHSEPGKGSTFSFKLPAQSG